MNFDDRMTRDQYELLRGVSDHLIDELVDAVVEVMTTSQPDPLLNWLPSQFSRHYTPLFAKKFLIAAITVISSLDQWDGESEVVTCTAEAFALHHVIELAKLQVEIQAGMDNRELLKKSSTLVPSKICCFPMQTMSCCLIQHGMGSKDPRSLKRRGCFCVSLNGLFLTRGESGCIPTVESETSKAHRSLWTVPTDVSDQRSGWRGVPH